MKAQAIGLPVRRRNEILRNGFFKRIACAFGLLAALGFAQTVFAAEAGTIKGIVTALSTKASNPEAEVTPVAGAKLTLQNTASPDNPLKTVTNVGGEFIFDNLPAGSYILMVEADGLSSVTRQITLADGAQLALEIDLTGVLSASVVIKDEDGLLSTSETSTSNIVRLETLQSQPLKTDNFQNAIQLTPGAIRDGFGNDYLKGTRTGQSGYTVNGTDVTDPATGNLAFDIPLESAQSVQIEENPYSAEYGKFTGGVTNLQTKGGGDKFKIALARFFPTFHNVFSATIDSFRPRVTVSGPVVAGKIFFLQSFEYRFSQIAVPGLIKPGNNITQEGFNSFTQIDWNINKNNTLKFNAAIFPAKFRNLGLDTFTPAETTPDYKQRGMLLSVSEQSVFTDTSFLSSEISYKTFDADIYGKSEGLFTIAPETENGSYFADTFRRTKRLQWQETYYSRTLKFYGDHSFKAGFEFDRTEIGGRLLYRPVEIRRLNGTLTERINFENAAPLAYQYEETSAFITDRWVPAPNLTLDYGVRLDRDGVTGNTNLAPRFSFLFLPLKDQRTVVRGGIGIFYDRSLAAAGLFDNDDDSNIDLSAGAGEQIPERTVTVFGPNGLTQTGPSVTFENQIAGRLLTPRSVRWSVQLDHRLSKNLTARIGFLRRTEKNDLLVEPVPDSSSAGTLALSSTGRSSYDEMQLVAAYQSERLGQFNASYVLSRARGDLNTADLFFGNTPAPVVRPNEYGRLPFDAPHRFLFYGQIDLSKKHEIRFAPLFEMRSGFPFSMVGERLEYIGGRNAAGRFPTYLALDLQATKGIKLPFFKDKRARVGFVLFNVTNHFNPRDVQMNLTAPNFRQFYNSLGISAKAKFEIDF